MKKKVYNITVTFCEVTESTPEEVPILTLYKTIPCNGDFFSF